VVVVIVVVVIVVVVGPCGLVQLACQRQALICYGNSCQNGGEIREIFNVT